MLYLDRYTRRGIAWVVIGLVGASGCGLALPSVANPGHLVEQQLRSNFHDPFGDVHLGPDISGGRPREYGTPRTQPVQDKWFLDR